MISWYWPIIWTSAMLLTGRQNKLEQPCFKDSVRTLNHWNRNCNRVYNKHGRVFYFPCRSMLIRGGPLKMDVAANQPPPPPPQSWVLGLGRLSGWRTMLSMWWGTLKCQRLFSWFQSKYSYQMPGNYVTHFGPGSSLVWPQVSLVVSPWTKSLCLSFIYSTVKWKEGVLRKRFLRAEFLWWERGQVWPHNNRWCFLAEKFSSQSPKHLGSSDVCLKAEFQLARDKRHLLVLSKIHRLIPTSSFSASMDLISGGEGESGLEGGASEGWQGWPCLHTVHRLWSTACGSVMLQTTKCTKQKCKPVHCWCNIPTFYVTAG